MKKADNFFKAIVFPLTAMIIFAGCEAEAGNSSSETAKSEVQSGDAGDNNEDEVSEVKLGDYVAELGTIDTDSSDAPEGMRTVNISLKGTYAAADGSGA